MDGLKVYRKQWTMLQICTLLVLLLIKGSTALIDPDPGRLFVPIRRFASAQPPIPASQSTFPAPQSHVPAHTPILIPAPQLPPAVVYCSTGDCECEPEHDCTMICNGTCEYGDFTCPQAPHSCDVQCGGCLKPPFLYSRVVIQALGSGDLDLSCDQGLCSEIDVNCPNEPYECNMLCTTKYECQSVGFHAKNSGNVHISCTADLSCRYGLYECPEYPSRCEVDCEGVCEDITVYCPNGDCVVNCHDGRCEGLEFFCGPGSKCSILGTYNPKKVYIYSHDPKEDFEGNVRLVGTTPGTGRAQFYWHGLWTPIAPWDHTFDMVAVDVVCKSLGFHGGYTHWEVRDIFGSLLQLGWLHSEILCVGDEKSLQQCPMKFGQHIMVAPYSLMVTCRFEEDAVDEYEGNARVVPSDPRKPEEGRVEIFHDGRWGSVCGTIRMGNVIGVACRYVGYSGSHGIRTTVGRGWRFSWLNESLECVGGERRLQECNNFEYYGQTCEYDPYRVGDIYTICNALPCTDWPNWMDTFGDCEVYGSGNWCQLADEYGEPGNTAEDACCTCGGGYRDTLPPHTRFPTQEPTPIQTLLPTASPTQTANPTHAPTTTRKPTPPPIDDTIGSHSPRKEKFCVVVNFVFILACMLVFLW